MGFDHLGEEARPARRQGMPSPRASGGANAKDGTDTQST